MFPFSFLTPGGTDVGCDSENDEEMSQKKSPIAASTPVSNGEKRESPHIRSRLFASPVRVRTRGTPTAVVGPRKADHSFVSQGNDDSTVNNHSNSFVFQTPTSSRRSIGALAGAPGLYGLTSAAVSNKSVGSEQNRRSVSPQFYFSWCRPSGSSNSMGRFRNSASPVRRSVSAGVNAMLSSQEHHMVPYNTPINGVHEGTGDTQLRISMLEEKLETIQSQMTQSGTNGLKSSWSCPKIQYAAVAFSAEDGSAMEFYESLQREINKLKDKLDHSIRQRDLERTQYQIDQIQTNGQLDTYKSRVNELSAECRMWREKAADLETKYKRSSVHRRTVTEQAKEIEQLRHENEQLRSTCVGLTPEDLNELCNEMEWLKLNYDAACTSLDFKETECDELRKSDKHSEPAAATAATSQNTELNVTPSPLPASRDVRAMLANQQQQLKKCHFAVKCLMHTSKKLSKGEVPDLNRLLGCRSDSVSDSDPEGSTRSSPSSKTASIRPEVQLGKNQAKLDTLVSDLESLQNGIIDFYAGQMAQQACAQESCRIQ